MSNDNSTLIGDSDEKGDVQSSQSADAKQSFPNHQAADNANLAALTVAAMGVVYGDIGTSPLYALRECFHGPYALDVSPLNVMGVLSLILWSLLLIISVKYLTFVLRADNEGEGGIIALMALANRGVDSERQKWLIILLGLFGAGLLYGDGVITPAISVLSAVEGLRMAAPSLENYVIPITIGILVCLFLFQRRGTTHVGRLFGPIMIVWFAIIAIMGIAELIDHPAVLAAVSPHYAVNFFIHNRLDGFLILGVVFLVVTGGEALYADLGHFGTKPIRLAWFAFVLPALVLNYFGQGSLLLNNPNVAESPFYYLASGPFKIPLVILATVATVIASQAVITGAFSMAYQAVQLGLSPRLKIVHTSKDERGQIYVPAINWLLLFAVVGLVLVFQTSTKLASAYGMAVTTTMVITALLLYIVARNQWGWTVLLAGFVVGLFLVIDLGFFAANLIKVMAGGWLPLLIGVVVCVLMTTWKRGREIVTKSVEPQLADANVLFTAELEANPPNRVDIPAVYLTANTKRVPLALVHNLHHNRVLHQPLALLSIVTEPRPYVPLNERLEINRLEQGICRIIAHYGFKQNPNVPNILDQAKQDGVDFTNPETTFFLGHISVEVTNVQEMPRWRKYLFLWMANNAHDASKYFGIPPGQVVEIGTRLEI